MELDPSLVLRPEPLVEGLVRGEEFDVTRVRSALVAELRAARGALPAPRALRSRCSAVGKPTYVLKKDDEPVSECPRSPFSIRY